MEFPFLTVREFNGKSLQMEVTAGVSGGGHAHSWDENAGEEPYEKVFVKVREILDKKGETLQHIARLRYDDPKQFDNKMYRLDGSKNQYFLKILGENKGNLREIYAWRVLGYGVDGKRKGQTWIPGLPPEVHALPIGSVLTRFYPGQLKAVPGKAYEFPLVMALVLHLERTLSALHEAGLIYMDLCPDNLLFQDGGDQRPMLFFITDMGSVKIAMGHEAQDENWQKLRELVQAVRLTRAETMPPEDEIPPLENYPLEEPPDYDWHTLARTAYILLGLGASPQPNRDRLGYYADRFNVERPLDPRGAEFSELIEILDDCRKGEPPDRERLYELFKNFFLDRAAFAAQYIDHAEIKAHWSDLLAQRLIRYKTVLESGDKTQLREKVLERINETGSGGMARELTLLQNLPQRLLDKDFTGAVTDFAELASAEILKVSPTARYAYTYHKKLLRHLARGHDAARSFLKDHGGGGTGWLDEIPEKKTIEALRAGKKARLGILNRKIRFPSIHAGHPQP